MRLNFLSLLSGRYLRVHPLETLAQLEKLLADDRVACLSNHTLEDFSENDLVARTDPTERVPAQQDVLLATPFGI
jgi:hypothetical protein